MNAEDEADFRAFVVARSPALLRTAYLLTGDAGHAEDLLQTSLLKTYRHWSRITDRGRPEAFVRRVLVNTQASWWRRRRVVEHSTNELPERGGDRDESTAVGVRDEIWVALRTLPPKMRAVVVLRYWDDLSEAETAHLLGCSPGTVKSQASRGLARLRQLIPGAGDEPPPVPPLHGTVTSLARKDFS